MKKNLIIGVFGGYEWEQIAPWVHSIKRSDFQGDIVVVALNTSYETVEKLIASDCKVIIFNRDDENRQVYHTSPVKVHVERFLFIYNYLKDNWQDYDYIITTDMRDVIFQSDPVAWLRDNLGDKKIIAPGEGIRIKDEPWNRQNFLETYGAHLYAMHKDFEAYNVGTLGGLAQDMTALALNIYSAGINRAIPIVDQAVFNYLVQSYPYKDTVKFVSQSDTWAEQAGVNVDPSKIEEYRPFLLHKEPLFDNGVVKTAAGKPFCIVHQYDRVPLWKDYFLKQYES
jgi:hypothetical protein